MNYRYNKIIAVMHDWNDHYGGIKITELPKHFIIQLSTGGWSENEDIARDLYAISDIIDNGGHYIVSIAKYTLSDKEQDVLRAANGKVFKKKKFKYVYERD